MALTKVDISLMDNATGFTIVTKIVTVAASKLVIDGVSQDTLTLTEGYTYKFDTSHATMSGHTVSFATAADAAGSTEYTTGVTTSGTPGSANAYTQIVVAQSASALYYYCANHASMGGTISTPAAVIANKLLAYDGSGNLPVVDGSQLTNVATGVTASSSDPTISTNPSGGVGTEWHNTTSGEVYICTDATAGENVWTNVGAGSGDVQPWAFQGSTYGFSSGGYSPQNDVIDRFAFSSNTTATDHGNLSVARTYNAGSSSLTYGYTAGGGYPTHTNIIDKFAFSANVTGTDVGNLTGIASAAAGHSSETHGFASGGISTIARVDKYSFTSDGNASSHGNLSVGRGYCAGHSSETQGFTSGGGSHSNVIDKFNYSSNTTAADHGDLAIGMAYAAGQSSATYGFCATGNYPASNTINKFAFSSNTTATDWGDLTVSVYLRAGQSGITHGFASGGSSNSNVIDKFSYASNAGSTDHGDLSQGREAPAGQQV